MRVVDRIGDVRVAWSERMGPDAGRRSQMSARPPGRSTRPISARPAVGSAQWCIDKLLMTRSNELSGNAREAASPTRNDGRRSPPFPGRSALARARSTMAGSRSRPVTSQAVPAGQPLRQVAGPAPHLQHPCAG